MTSSIMIAWVSASDGVICTTEDGYILECRMPFGKRFPPWARCHKTSRTAAWSCFFRRLVMGYDQEVSRLSWLMLVTMFGLETEHRGNTYSRFMRLDPAKMNSGSQLEWDGEHTYSRHGYWHHSSGNRSWENSHCLTQYMAWWLHERRRNELFRQAYNGHFWHQLHMLSTWKVPSAIAPLYMMLWITDALGIGEFLPRQLVYYIWIYWKIYSQWGIFQGVSNICSADLTKLNFNETLWKRSCYFHSRWCFHQLIPSLQECYLGGFMNYDFRWQS